MLRILVVTRESVSTCGDGRALALRQTLRSAPSDRHDRVLRVHAEVRGEDAGVHHIKTRYIMCLQIRPDDALFRICAGARGAEEMRRHELDHAALRLRFVEELHL